MNSPTLSSSSSFPRGLRLTSFIKVLLMLGIFIVVISHTYWNHLTDIRNVFTPISTNVDVDKPTGHGWGMGAMQHYDANVGKGKEEQAGYDRLSGGTDSGKQEEGGKVGAEEEEEEEENELEELDLNKGKEAKQPSTQPTQPAAKPAAEEVQKAQEEETVPTMEETWGGNGAAPADANVHTVKGNDESLARPLMDAGDAKKAGLLVSTQAKVEEMDRVGAVEEAEKSAGDKEGSGQTSEDENAAPSMNGKGSEGEKSASVLYNNAQVQDSAAGNKTDDSKSAGKQTSPKDKTVDEAKLTMGTEKEAKFAAEVKAKTDAETTSSEDRKVAEVGAIKKESEGDKGEAKEEAEGKSKNEEQGEAEPKEGEGSAKAVADARAKMEEEEEAKAKVEMEKKKAKEEHEKNMYAGPKWTPLKRPGERKKSNNLMDYDFLPD